MSDDFIDPMPPQNAFSTVWHSPGMRTYHSGVDRGMLYLDHRPGVPWPGLISVVEKPIGGDIRPIYVDGQRRRNDHKLEEFSASISAFTAPQEFAECVGERELAPGLFLGQQRRSIFGFSYRSLIGSDISQLGDDYELNLIYAAMAEPSGRDLQTMTQSSEVAKLTWTVETVPQLVAGAKPSARVRLDTRRTNRDRLREIEEILYGISGSDPRLPPIDEVVTILNRVDYPPVEEIAPGPPEVEPVED